MSAEHLPPGWYDDETGRRRYWDGSTWLTPVPQPQGLTVQQDAYPQLAASKVADSPPYETQLVAGPPEVLSESLRSRRTKTTWGAVSIAIVGSLFLHWLSQALAGGMVGAVVGSEGLNRISYDEVEAINIFATIVTLFITAVVTVVVGNKVYDDFSPPWEFNELRGVRWWHSCWAPILVGTLIYGSCFFMAFYRASTP